MHYIVYRTTNLKNGKVYTGAHITKNLNDGYLGSGKLLKLAIKKYGENNFIRHILVECDSKEQMYQKESELVFIGKNSYNIKNGGEGGFDHLNRASEIQRKKALSANKKMEHLRHTDKEWRKKEIEKMKNLHVILDRWRKENPEKVRLIAENAFRGKRHSESSKQQMSLSHKGKRVGDKNGSFGTCWITNGVDNKRIKKELLDKYVEMGYTCGRIP